MKLYKLLVITICCFTIISCETQQEVIETGVSNPIYEGTIMEYLRTDDMNWKHTVKMIEKAGMEDLFDGKDANYPEITFLGLKSYSIIRHVWDLQSAADEELINEENVIDKLTKDECRAILEQYIVKGKILKSDLAERDYNYLIFDEQQTGYTELTTLSGNKLRAYIERSDFAGVPRAGATFMYIYSMNLFQYVTLATPDIQPDNGVVHALGYSHVLGKL